MDSNVKQEPIDEMRQNKIKNEDLYKDPTTPYALMKCTAFIEMYSSNQIVAVDKTGISIFNDHGSCILFHGPKTFTAKFIYSKARVVIKNMIKQEFDFDGKQYRFDLVLDFKDCGDLRRFLDQLEDESVGYTETQ